MNKVQTKRKPLPAILLVLLLSSFALNQTEKQKPAIEDVIRENITLAPCKNGDRLEAVKNLFKAAGAADSDLKIEKFKEYQNLVVTKKGKTAETVIVGAHYDKVDAGCGAIDNWTGIVMIANLFRTIKDASTYKTYMFVAFDREESGLLGSHAMAKAIPKENISGFCSMINLDSFGFTYPQVLDNASSPKMSELAKTTVTEMGIAFGHASLAGVADADSSSFLERKIPAITFHGLSANWQEYLHSSKDKLENINANSVIIGYQFTLNYIAKIDKLSCDTFRK